MILQSITACGIGWVEERKVSMGKKYEIICITGGVEEVLLATDSEKKAKLRYQNMVRAGSYVRARINGRMLLISEGDKWAGNLAPRTLPWAKTKEENVHKLKSPEQREKRAERSRNYYRQNREKIQARRKELYAQDPERIKGYKKAYKERLKEAGGV